jgi:hypothetical protein
MENNVNMEKPNEFTKINLAVFLVKEGDFMVAYCPALELSSYGETEKEAKIAFGDSLKIFLEDTEEKGTLVKCLLDLGWQIKNVPTPKYVPPKIGKDYIKRLFSTQSEPHKINEEICIPV